MNDAIKQLTDRKLLKLIRDWSAQAESGRCSAELARSALARIAALRAEAARRGLKV